MDHHDHHASPESKAPRNTKCELCGMVAVSQITDNYGVEHSYCEHHQPRHSATSPEGNPTDVHADHSANLFRDKFWLSLALTLPVLAWSELAQRLFKYTVPEFLGSFLISPVFASIVFFYGGLVFIRGAINELKQRQPGMMTLITVAILVAYAYSLFVTIVNQGGALYWELTSLITIMLLGHWMELRSVSSAQGALHELSKLLPDTAELVEGPGTKTVPVAALKQGDSVLIRPGVKVPTDGKVIEGTSSINESIITGESVPVEKRLGSEVIAGTINAEGALTIEITNIGEQTALAGIMRLVAEALRTKSNTQILADRAAFWLTIIAIGGGAITLFAWIALGQGFGFGIERSVAVLVIACPHALGLAIPLVTSISTSLSARNGLLIRDRKALEAARNLNAVIFDKTGTLTTGELSVTDVRGRDFVLQCAASIEAKSEHGIGKAIVEKAKQQNIPLMQIADFTSYPGKGISGVIEGKTVVVGKPVLLNERGVHTESCQDDLERFAKEGKTSIQIAVRNECVGVIGLADTLKPESTKAVVTLQQMGIEVFLLTGDNELTAAAVATQVGIPDDHVFANVQPSEKSSKVKELQARGLQVAMVGDGVNDAPALVQANLGIAIGAGTDVAIESADIVLIKSDPRDIVNILKLARATYRKMVENLIWATGYNVVAIPLAAGVLVNQGILMPPAVGALFMSLSTVIVAINAQLLRRLKLSEPTVVT